MQLGACTPRHCQVEADGHLSRACLKRFLASHKGGAPIDQTYKEWFTLHRVIGHRTRRSAGAARPQLEYLCKWNGLTYAECSWEVTSGGAVTSEAVAAYRAVSGADEAERAEEERRRKEWLTISAAVEALSLIHI